MFPPGMKGGGKYPNLCIGFDCLETGHAGTVTENDGHVPPFGREIEARAVHFGTHQQNAFGQAAFGGSNNFGKARWPNAFF